MVSAEGAGIEGQDEERTRAAVHEPQPSGQRQLVIMSPGSVQTLPLVGHGELTLGRSGRSAVRVDDPLLSREHLRVRWTADVTVEDLGSVNGTKLGDRQLQAHEQGQPEDAQGEEHREGCVAEDADVSGAETTKNGYGGHPQYGHDRPDDQGADC